MKHYLVLRVVGKLLIPFILLFGLYVITHGELGPGGGFQGGVVVACAFILFALIFGRPALYRVLPPPVCDLLTGLGVLMYSGTALRRFQLTVREIYFTGVLSLIIIVVSGLFVGMVLGLQGYDTLQRYGSS